MGVVPFKTKLLLVKVTTSVPPTLKSIWSSVSAVIEVSASASHFISVPLTSIPALNACSELLVAGGPIVPTLFAY